MPAAAGTWRQSNTRRQAETGHADDVNDGRDAQAWRQIRRHIREDVMTKSAVINPTRREVVRGIGAAGLGAASATLAQRAFAQAKKPVSISFWTFDNPQQRPWV